MQNAKDSFYGALRARLAVINPGRTTVLRGAVRPGILVEEAEASLSQLPNDVFVLRWLGLAIDTGHASPLAGAECEVIYKTCGARAFGGLDRGRSLATMDKDLAAMLLPRSAAKFDYTVQPPRSMLTQLFWDEPAYTPIVSQRDQLSRSVKVLVYSYQEQGE